MPEYQSSKLHHGAVCGSISRGGSFGDLKPSGEHTAQKQPLCSPGI